MLPPGMQDRDAELRRRRLDGQWPHFRRRHGRFQVPRLRDGDRREAGEIKLPSSVETTPITYMSADGTQFVTVVSTGASPVSEVTNDEIIAFALPKE